MLRFSYKNSSELIREKNKWKEKTDLWLRSVGVDYGESKGERGELQLLCWMLCDPCGSNVSKRFWVNLLRKQ